MISTQSYRPKLVGRVADALESCQTTLLHEIQKLNLAYRGVSVQYEHAMNVASSNDEVSCQQHKDIGAELKKLWKNIERETHVLTRGLQNVSAEISRIPEPHSRWNAYSPVARLPSELLSKVFSQLKALHLDEIKCTYAIDGHRRYTSEGPILESSPWEVVSHVCRMWRSVALGHAELWSTISFCWGLEKIHEFVFRSKEAVLQIYDVGTVRVIDLHILAGLLRRVEVLHASCWTDSFKDKLYAPILKEFTLNCECYSGDIHPLAALFRASAAPQLQRLHQVIRKWLAH